MKSRTTYSAIAACAALAIATTSPAATVQAGTQHGPTAPAAKRPPGDPHGAKHQVLREVKRYFEARDSGWLDEPDGSRGAGGRPPAARALAGIADELEQERGLRAVDVDTGFERRPLVRIRGHHARVSIVSATALTWNNDEVGESSLSDRYTVELERDRRRGSQRPPHGPGRWRVTSVAYAPIPDTDERAGSRGAPVRPAPPAPARPTERSDDSSAAATTTFDRAAAGEYARYWSGQDATAPDGVHVIWEDRYNSDYDRARQDNNCTNFASQALHAGGWPLVDGVDPANPDNWTYDLWGPYGPSESWSVAYKLWLYAIDEDRGTRLRGGLPGEADIWGLEPGDLIFADWDPDKRPDGRIDHAMVVSGSFTELGFTEPTYSQNTPHRQNLPLSVGIKIATAEDPTPETGGPMGGQGRTVHLYPVKVHDQFAG